jgi:hypothetical protein
MGIFIEITGGYHVGGFVLRSKANQFADKHDFILIFHSEIVEECIKIIQPKGQSPKDEIYKR